MSLVIKDVLADAATRLSEIESPRLEAEILLAHVLQVARSHFYAWPEREISSADCVAFEQLVTRRVSGTPVAYLTGRREFWSLELAVSPATLIPRPETECLVEQGLACLPSKPATVLDLGTGSGAVALAIAHERPDCRVIATDISAEALQVAQANALRLGIRNVEFVLSDWFDALPPLRAELVVANPPYIAAADPHLGLGDLRFEPRNALESGAQGLDAIDEIIRCAASFLSPDGWLWCEHGWEQAEAVRRLLVNQAYTKVMTKSDLNGHPRISGAQPGSA